MKTNLILTGWYYPEYMAAAAAVLRHYANDADVYAVSMASLASTLRQKGPNYRRIDILGVGLEDNLDGLAQIVRELRARKISVNWYSRQAMPVAASDAFGAAGTGFSTVGFLPRGTLVEVVGELFDNVSDKDVRWLKEIATSDGLTVEKYEAEKKMGAKGGRCALQDREVWPLLYKAAGFAHRDHQDDSACSLVVSKLLDLHYGNSSIVDYMPPALAKLMADYQAYGKREFIGNSAQMNNLRRRLDMAAKCSDASVLILGETGSGKDVAAEYIHNGSDRRGKKYEHYNCAYAADEGLLMSELFGHVKGAFTDAIKNKDGLFAQANGGTLFLDEIATASKKVQASLLLVLETGRYKPVGSEEERTTDVRLICATNEDLQQMVLDGTFRHDLYERICQFPVEIPPLRDHMEDLQAIADNYWRRMTGRRLTKRQVAALKGYDYSGNVRELIAILTQARTLGEEDFGKILAEHQRFNRKLIEGLRTRRRALGEATHEEALPAAQAAPGSIAEEWLDGDGPNARLDRLHHAWAVKIFEECSQNLKLATERSGVSRNTFKKYLDMKL